MAEERPSIAAALLRAALERGWMTPGALSAALGAGEFDLARLCSGDLVMTAKQRYRLAEALEEAAPPEFRAIVRSLRALALVDLTLAHEEPPGLPGTDRDPSPDS
jgi:hypothetical protein